MQESQLIMKKANTDPFKGQVVMDVRIVNGVIADLAGNPLDNGGVSASTTQTLYNASSMRFNGDSYFSLPNTNGSLWLTGEFTIEMNMWLLNKIRQFPALFGNYNTWPQANALQIFADHSSAANCYSVALSGAFPRMTSTSTPKYGKWSHTALTRDAAGVMNLWIDGKSESSFVHTVPLFGTKDRIMVGVASDSPINGGVNCYMDGIRVTNACRYTAQFIPGPFG